MNLQQSTYRTPYRKVLTLLKSKGKNKIFVLESFNLFIIFIKFNSNKSLTIYNIQIIKGERFQMEMVVVCHQTWDFFKEEEKKGRNNANDDDCFFLFLFFINLSLMINSLISLERKSIFFPGEIKLF